jgi:hypothetical protein
MKAITMIMLTIFLGKGCSQEAKNDLANATIEYVANTRGFYQKITIQNQKVYLNSDRNSTKLGDSKAISDADWKALVSSFETIELDSLPTLKDPTQKRFYDGAAIAYLKINYKDKEYRTTEFDHGFPPAEIETLVKKVVSFGEQE